MQISRPGRISQRDGTKGNRGGEIHTETNRGLYGINELYRRGKTGSQRDFLQQGRPTYAFPGKFIKQVSDEELTSILLDKGGQYASEGSGVDGKRWKWMVGKGDSNGGMWNFFQSEDQTLHGGREETVWGKDYAIYGGRGNKDHRGNAEGKTETGIVRYAEKGGTEEELVQRWIKRTDWRELGQIILNQDLDRPDEYWADGRIISVLTTLLSGENYETTNKRRDGDTSELYPLFSTSSSERFLDRRTEKELEFMEIGTGQKGHKRTGGPIYADSGRSFGKRPTGHWKPAIESKHGKDVMNPFYRPSYDTYRTTISPEAREFWKQLIFCKDISKAQQDAIDEHQGYPEMNLALMYPELRDEIDIDKGYLLQWKKRMLEMSRNWKTTEPTTLFRGTSRIEYPGPR